MALKGTLKDFGIADILQLIGQQQKTGVLYIKSKQEEVEVSFIEGNVARALAKNRKSKELLGSMLVRSAVISQAELDEALEVQKRTLKRLGDILVVSGKVTADELRQATQLQTSETIYRLFTWKTGTYEFIQQDVEHDPAQGTPIRPESMLMEGFRRVDEWPMVRKRLPSLNVSFERLKHLAPPAAAPASRGEELDAAFDAALDSMNSGADDAPKSIGRNERLAYKLADPGVSAQRICDLSRLGEFETSKALFNLLEAGYLRSIQGAKTDDDEAPRKAASEVGKLLRATALQTAVGLVVVVLFGVVGAAIGKPPAVDVDTVRADTGATLRIFADNQLARLSSSIEQYRLQRGKYPAQLRDLVEQRIATVEELQFPYGSDYHYRRTEHGYLLLPPLP